MPVVLYGYGTWSLTLREECRLRVFENGSRGECLGPNEMRMESGEGPKISKFLVRIVQIIH